MGEFGGQNAHSTLNTDCESGVALTLPVFTIDRCLYMLINEVPSAHPPNHFTPPPNIIQPWACFRP